jgi:hypothetical protein
MKFFYIFFLLLFSLISSPYADYRDDFPDETICLYLNKKSVSPYYVDQADKRGITCSGGIVVKKTNTFDSSTKNDEIETSYEEIEEIKENTIPKNNCSETKSAIVTTREFLSTAKSFIQLKNYVIDVSLQQAFQQINGSEIRNFDSLNMSDENGNEDINFNSSSSTKYAGLIDSYEIIDEEITEQFLILTLDANVCIKDKNAVTKDVLLVGDFTYQNSSFPALKSMAESIFSKESKSFELGYGKPSISYYDILITGRIDNVTTERVVNNSEAAKQAAEKRSDVEAETAAFFAIFGALKESQNEGEDVFANIMETVGGLKTAEMEGSTSSYSIVKVYVSVSANHKTDNRTYTATAETEHKVASSSYDLESLAMNAVEQASKDLFLKLNNRTKD